VTILSEERLSDSPYIETITRGRTLSAGSSIRPAEIHWHMVFVRHSGAVYPLLVGPLSTAGVASWGEGAEILWIRLKLGVFMPHLPARELLDGEKVLPDASSKRFWMNVNMSVPNGRQISCGRAFPSLRLFLKPAISISLT
jgi:hypothetical protein